MSQRFFVETPIVGDRARLIGPEAHHLAKVMRAQVGDSVQLFDGSGVEFNARIEHRKKDSAELAILERRAIDRELPFVLTIAVALPKGERQKWLLEKLVELGVTRLVPLVTERGVAQPVDQAVERLGRAVVEASKQCGRNRLLAVCPPSEAREWFRSAPPDALRWIADPAGAPLVNSTPDASSSSASSGNELCFAVGPEGGFTPDEVSAAHASGWQSVSLGRRILRIETAAIALAAWAAIERGGV